MTRKWNCFYTAHLKLLDSNPFFSQIIILIRFIDFVNTFPAKYFIFTAFGTSISNINSITTVFWLLQKDCCSMLKCDHIYLNQSLKSNQRRRPIKYKKGGFLCFVIKLFSSKKSILKPGEKLTGPTLKRLQGYLQI